MKLFFILQPDSFIPSGFEVVSINEKTFDQKIHNLASASMKGNYCMKQKFKLAQTSVPLSAQMVLQCFKAFLKHHNRCNRG